jgi:hypothetical protein
MHRWWTVVAALLVGVGAMYAAQPGRNTAGPRPKVKLLQSPADLVQGRVEEIKVGEPQRFGGLTMFPLIGRSIGGLDYLTLDEAMSQGAIRVGEKDEGEVNTIVIRNRSGDRVFIMDGEEVVGAKQNRVLNSSLMIGPKQIAEVPVSCVEQGRWASVSDDFKPAGTQLFARARQVNTPAVSENLAARPTAGAQGDQMRIWDEVAAKRANLSMAKPSGPMHEAYEKFDKDIGDYTRHFEIVSDQVGALFAINGEIVGADIFDQSRTLKRLFAKLVKSYALDAIEKHRTGPELVPDRDDARHFLQLVLEPGVSIHDYQSPGEGRDVRITSRRINGAALVVAQRAVHVSLFAPEKGAPELLRPSSGLRPPRERRELR